MMSDAACICTLCIAFISTETFVQFVIEEFILRFTKDDNLWIVYESVLLFHSQDSVGIAVSST